MGLLDCRYISTAQKLSGRAKTFRLATLTRRQGFWLSVSTYISFHILILIYLAWSLWILSLSQATVDSGVSGGKARTMSQSWTKQSVTFGKILTQTKKIICNKRLPQCHNPKQSSLSSSEILLTTSSRLLSWFIIIKVQHKVAALDKILVIIIIIIVEKII